MTPADHLTALYGQLLDPQYPLHSRVHKMHSIPIYIKRDDELGFATGGSKIRKYASLIPFLKKQEKPLALYGSAYSNHILAMVQLLKQENLPYKLFLEKPKSPGRKGNFFFLSLLIGEESCNFVHKSLENLMQDLPDFFWIQPGGSMPASLPGALTLASDILLNETQLGMKFSHIVLDAGTGFTAIALILGLSYLKRSIQVHVILVAGTPESFYQELSRFQLECEKLLRTPLQLGPYTLYSPLTGKSFGSCNQATLKIIQETAQKDGIFLDPLYSAKSLLTIPSILPSLTGEVLYIHGGGSLSLAGFQDKLKGY